MLTIRYLIVLAAVTVWAGVRVILASWAGVKYRPGGIYDRAGRGWGRGMIRGTGVTVETVGLERLDPARPVMFASNHSSMMDIWALMAVIPHSFRFVAKQELLKIPLFGRAMRSAGHISIDRSRIKSTLGAYQEAAETMRRGLSAVVFVEGTRGSGGDLLPFKRGSFSLGILAAVPVVPVYIADSWRILPSGSRRPIPGPIHILFGEPIPTTGLTVDDRDALAARTRAAMERLRAGVDGHGGGN